MTIPSEEMWALKRTRKFLSELITMKLTDIRKNPKELKRQASSCIRHFPWDMTVEEIWKERIGDFNETIKKD